MRIEGVGDGERLIKNLSKIYDLKGLGPNVEQPSAFVCFLRGGGHRFLGAAMLRPDHAGRCTIVHANPGLEVVQWFHAMINPLRYGS